MEKFVLGIFQEHLSKVIVGFRKEQVNANFLNGKGEIKDVSLNCSLLNAALSTTSPSIQAESVHISKLSIQVESWRTTVPQLHVTLEHVEATFAEPLHYVASSRLLSSTPHPVLQLSPSQLAAVIGKGLLPSSTSSSTAGDTTTTILDRIVDAMTVDSVRVRLTLQPLGTFKTTVPGPWTPPAIRLELLHVRWRNAGDTQKQKERAREYVHKKLVTDYRLSLVLPNTTTTTNDQRVVIPLLDTAAAAASGSTHTTPATALEVSITLVRPRKVRTLLVVDVGVQWIRPWDITLASHHLPLVHQAAVALASCLAKQRAFVDPVVGVRGVVAAAVQQQQQCGTTEGGGEPVVMAKTTTTTSSRPAAPALPALADMDDDDDEEEDEDTAVVLEGATVGRPTTDNSSGHPILLFCQSGTMIYERFSLRCSIRAVSIKGVYAATPITTTKDDTNSAPGRVQLVARGVVLEALWPKVTHEKGGHVQASISYVSLQEQQPSRMIRPLLLGGAKYERLGSGSVGTGTPLRELRREETFPLFEEIQPEDDSMRPSSFPAQAVGFKMTAGVLEVDAEDFTKDEVLILHEIGIDHMEVTADAAPWCRVVQFLANVEGGGYDPRWESGDWSDVLTVDMLVRPNEPLHLKDHTQPAGSSSLLDENDLLSSDLFNVTMKLTNSTVRVPAAIAHDIRSCDVCLAMDELVAVVSSGLPRCLHANDREDICFPHDPADMVHTAAFGGGLSDISNQSTFRTQLTFKGLSVTLRPVLPLHCGMESRRLVAPSDMMLLVCLEGVVTADNVVHMSLIISATTQEINVNIDVDLLVSAASTLVIHAETVAKLVKAVESASSANDSSPPTAIPSQDCDIHVQDTLEGRKVLVEKQVERSMESGSVRIAVWSKLTSTKVAFWRQNVPRNNPLQQTSGPPVSEFVPLLRVLQVVANGIDFGMELSKQKEISTRLRLSANETRLDIVHFTELMKNATIWQKTFADTLNSAEIDKRASCDMLNLLRCGLGVSNDAPGFTLRLEQDASSSKAYSLACELRDGSVNVVWDDLETAALLVLESLLLPVWSTQPSKRRQDTVGSFLSGVLSPTRDAVVVKHDKSFAASAILQTAQGFCDTVLFRFGIDNTTLLLPADSLASNYRFQVDGTEILLSTKFLDSHAESPLLGAIASGTTTWKSIFSTRYNHHVAKLSSSLSLLQDSVQNANDTKLIGPLEVTLLSVDSSMSSSVTDVGELWKIADIEQITTCLEECTKRLSSITCSVQTYLGRHSETDSSAGNNLLTATGVKVDSPVQLTLQSARWSIESAEKSFLAVNQCIATLDKTVKAKAEMQESTITELRTLLFKKEEERLAAISLCVSQQRGWLRLGSPRRSGQRGLISCALWPYWVVLTGTLVFLYSSPDQNEIVDVISLTGATLHSATGGQSRRDMNRTAVLVDETGCAHYIVASTNSEYMTWVHAIQAATKQTRIEDVEKGVITLSEPILTDRNMQETFATRKRTNSSESESTALSLDREQDAGVFESAESGSFRSRFALVSQATKKGLDLTKKATKTRLGSVMETARKKGKEVAENGRIALQDVRAMPINVPPGESPSATDVISEEESHEEAVTHHASDSVASFWSCPSCTYVNSRGTTCQVCEAPRVFDRSSSEGEPSDDEFNSSSRRTGGMRRRLGAVVRRARSRNGLQPQRPPPSGAPPPMQIRNVSVLEQEMKPAVDPIGEHVDSPLANMKILEGIWTIEVVPDSGEADSDRDSDNDDDAVQDQLRENCERDENPTNNQAREAKFCFITRNHQPTTPVVETRRTLSEVLTFHTALSEHVSQLPFSFDWRSSDFQEAPDGWPNSVWDLTKASAKHLKCFLEFKPGFDRDAYRVEVDFVNAVVQCPLPLDYISLLTEFLALPDASTRAFAEATSQPTELPPPALAAEANITVDSCANEAMTLAVLCETELLRTSKQLDWAQHICAFHEITTTTIDHMAPTVPRSFASMWAAEHMLEGAMHSALLKTMEERDEAHARLIATEVLHVHELEQKRRQVEALESQLQLSRQHATDSNLFASDKERKQFEALRQHDQDRQRDTDAELLSLCQQLAGEISSRTAANLEVIRLKEIRKIAKESEKAEKQSLQDEILQLREQLRLERQESAALKKSSVDWRSSFEQLVQVKGQTHGSPTAKTEDQQGGS